MQRNMLRRPITCALVTGVSLSLSACGGGSSSNMPPPAPATMAVTISDASSDDWACVGVRVLSIALVPVGGGSPVTVWSAPTPAPYVNLEQLDQLGEILGNVSVPVTNPETAIASAQALTIDADSANGTIVYDLDAGSRSVVNNFGGESALNGKYVRVAARYQEDGTLVAVRVWASTQFAKVWLSPEGHVLHVDSSSDVIMVADEDGRGVPVTVNAATQFFFRTPYSVIADATPIATGTGFLASQDLVRGFKVHVSAVDPLAVPMVADTIDIETAAYGGHISNVSGAGFTYTSQYFIANDNYSVGLGYIAASLANGFDDNGSPINGFKWWDFTFPTTVTFGNDAIASFAAAAGGAVNFGGTVGALPAWGESVATWGDGGSHASGWYVRDAVLVPTPLPLGTVSTAFATNTFAIIVPGGAVPVTVDVGTTMGSATLVYQIDRANRVITVSPIDITTPAGLAAITAGLIDGAPVKVFGVPQAPVAAATTGTLRAYVIVYYTGTMPSM